MPLSQTPSGNPSPAMPPAGVPQVWPAGSAPPDPNTGSLNSTNAVLEPTVPSRLGNMTGLAPSFSHSSLLSMTGSGVVRKALAPCWPAPWHGAPNGPGTMLFMAKANGETSLICLVPAELNVTSGTHPVSPAGFKPALGWRLIVMSPGIDPVVGSGSPTGFGFEPAPVAVTPLMM